MRLIRRICIKIMLQYIYNVEIGIPHDYLELVVDDYEDILNNCCSSNNRDAYMYIFRHLLSNQLEFNPNWRELTLYLLEAIELYPPHQELAKKILSNLICGWSKDAEQVVKKLLPVAEIDSDDISFSQYSHLVPHLEPLSNNNGLNNAFEYNNVEEVKHRIQYYDPNNMDLLWAVATPIDNRECFALILPLLNNKECPNTYIISAYVNNKLPDYTIPKHKYNVCVQAIICHFTGSAYLGGVEWNNNLIIDIADKLNFSVPLTYECIRRAIECKSFLYRLSPNMEHKVDVVRRRMALEKPMNCNCDFCSKLTKNRL